MNPSFEEGDQLTDFEVRRKAEANIAGWKKTQPSLSSSAHLTM